MSLFPLHYQTRIVRTADDKRQFLLQEEQQQPSSPAPDSVTLDPDRKCIRLALIADPARDDSLLQPYSVHTHVPRYAHPVCRVHRLVDGFSVERRRQYTISHGGENCPISMSDFLPKNADELKALLQAAFPGVKFAVRAE